MNSETGRLISDDAFKGLPKELKAGYAHVAETDLTLKQKLEEQVSIFDNRSIAGKLRIQHKNSKRNLPCPCGSGKKFKKCCWYKLA